MTNLPALVHGLAGTVSTALRELASHLNHDQITGTLEAAAAECEAIAEMLRQGEDLVDELVPDATPETTGRHEAPAIAEGRRDG